MAKKKKIRLFKIASEINIGRDAIVDLLKTKGFDIENKPTASLDVEMMDAVYDKFKKEKLAIDKQRQKLEKHKMSRKPASEEQEPEAKASSEPVAVKAPAEEIKAVETAVEVEGIPEEKPKEEEKVIIDLSQFEKPKKKAKAKKKDEPIVEEKSEEKIEVEAPKETPKKEEKKKAPAPAKKEKLEAKKKVKKVAEEPIQEEPEQIEEVKDTELIEKEKPAKPSEAEEIENGHKLKGLKIVGKIELAKEKPAEDSASKKKKLKKRKRKKGVIDITTEQGTDTSAPKKGKKKTSGKSQEKPKAGSKDKPDKKRRRKKSVRELVKDEDVEAAMKKTLAGMETSASSASKTRLKHKKQQEKEEKELKKVEELEVEKKNLQLTEFVTTSDLAKIMNVTANEIILKCMELGLMVSINQRLDKDTITLISDDYGYIVEFINEKIIQTMDDEEDAVEDLEPRSPIVTIMGHVDHGKTSLLDYIRHENVVAGEAGGITQHVGAYRVELPDDKYITFLDTPGHEAFTAMRARGAQVTDIVVLVVAADDSVMPQTLEAISHAQAADVPIVVAINKMDKPDANPDRIKQQLADQNILVEDWGGKYQSIELSAKSGLNVELLLEKILLEAEILELKANPKRNSRCTIVEAHMDKGFGPVSTVIVQKGTLKIGESFVCGVHSGRVRAMFDERGNKVTSAKPSIPVRCIGYSGLPEAGDILAVVDTDQEAKAISSQRSQRKRQQEFKKVHQITLDDISQQISLGDVRDLHLVIKADVGGSSEALADSLLRLSHEEVRVNILHTGVGSINESDVMLAMASGAIIIGFNVNPTAKARKVAERESVEIRLYNIIYDAINEVQLALEGLLAPEIVEEKTSEVEVRRLFKISKTGTIAGCYVKSGKINRNDKVRVLRDGLKEFDGSIQTLKREKDDVKEVDTGYECGVLLSGFNSLKVGDIIESYKVTEVKRTF